MTALTLYGSKIASGTLAAAGTMASAVGGTESGTSTAVLSSTTGTYLEIWGKGTATAQNAVMALPAPTGNGWLFDVTTLQGQTIAAGNWTPTVSLSNTFMSLASVTIYVRFYKRSSGGVYTAIGTASVTGQTITTSRVTFAVTAASLPATSFAVGDKLYVDLFLYASANWGGSSYSVATYESSTATGVASDMQIVTPGYTPTSGGSNRRLSGGRFGLQALNTIGYAYEEKITIDHTKVSGSSNLTSFPVLISYTDLTLRTTGNGGSVTNASGFDIIFVDTTGLIQLDHEIVSYTAATGAIVMWVRIPTLSYTADTVIYCYYGNAAITTTQENVHGVWDSSYAGVWHLQESGTGAVGEFKDSTTNVNHGQGGAGTSAKSSTRVAGKFGYAQSFLAASTQYIQVPNTTSLSPTGTQLTLEVWISPNSSAVSLQTFLGKDGYSTGYRSGTSHSSINGSFFQIGAAGAPSNLDSTALTPNGTWAYLAQSWDGATMRQYINTVVDVTTLARTTNLVSGTTALTIGSSGASYWYNGSLQEIRISTVARSADWITTTYNNQNSPSTFYTVGPSTSQAASMRWFATGRAKISASMRRFASGRVKLAVSMRRFASGRAAIRATQTRLGRGRLNLTIAGGTTYTANPGDNLQAKASALLPGDTLILNDGTYLTTPTTQGLRIEGIHGTTASPIIIKAAHDGMAIIDGQNGSAGNYEPIFVNASSYITIQGIIAKNSYADVVYLYGGGGGIDHITLQRVTAHDAGNGNFHVFDIATAPVSNILLEDCAGWGQGRYIFSAYHASNVTFRRCFGHWQGQPGWLGAPRASFNIYGAKNATLENCIAIGGTPTAPGSTDYFAGLYHTSDDTVNAPADNAQILGCVFYNNWEGYWLNDSAGTNALFQDCYFEAALNTSAWTNTPQGDGWRNNENVGTHTITNCTFRNSVVGWNKQTAITGTFTLTNNAFVGNTTGIINDPGHSHCAFFGNTANGATTIAGDVTTDPLFNTATYGRGGAFFASSASPLKGAGVSGADIGANILYQYVNGVKTATPLWPWPMESRIMGEHAISPTYTTNGGSWTTLTGVYSTPMTRRATGRVKFAIHTAKSAAGRFALALHKTMVSAGRTAIRAPMTRFAQGRMRLAAVQRLFGMGRAKIRASMTRFGSARFFLVGAHRLLASGRTSLQVGKRLLSAGRFRLVVAQRLLARGRFSIKAGRRVIAQGRTALRVMQTRLASGRFAVQAFFQQTRKAVGRMALSVSFGGVGYASTILANSPAAYYRFGEASGPNAGDASGHGNTATYSATGIAYSQAGALTADANTAVLLDGSTGYIDVPASVAPNTYSALTLEAWFYLPSLVALNRDGRLFANSHTDADNKGLQLFIANGGLGGAFFLGNGVSATSLYVSANNFAAATWYHLVATWDGSTMKLYINGNLNNSGPFTGPIAASGFDLNIGRNPAYAGDYFPGVVDEATISPTALTLAQVQANYAARSAGVSTRPTARGRFAVQSLLSHRLFAQGRANIRVASTRASQGRLALWITTHQTRLSQGRVALRVAFTRLSQGRFLLRVPFTRAVQGRIAIAVRRTLAGTGRAKILAAGRRLAGGRFSLALRHTLASSGRTAIRAGHTLLGAGRFALILIGTQRRAAIGRYTMRASKTQLAAGRFLTSVRQTRIATGRARISARITRLAVGRVALYVPRRMTAMGRMVLMVASRKFSMARFKLALERMYQARARVAIAAIQRLFGVGRFRMMVRKTANSQGRAAFRVQMTRKANGRAVFQVRHSLFGGGRIALRQGITQRRFGSGRAKMRVGVQRAAIARFLVHIVQAHASAGRLHVSVSRRTTGVGRFALVPTTFSDITVQGTSGQITVQGTSGQITVQEGE